MATRKHTHPKPGPKASGNHRKGRGVAPGHEAVDAKANATKPAPKPKARQKPPRKAAGAPLGKAQAAASAPPASGPKDAPGGLFLTAPPGLEATLADEARAIGLVNLSIVPGGVTASGGLAEAMRANLWLRGAGQVLWRIASFRALHLAQLDKRARRVDWAAILRPDIPVRIEATCRKSRIYHAGAARSRLAAAIADSVGPPVDDDSGLRVMLRIEDDLAVISLDTSGVPLHRRGLKLAVAKAPLRETMAAGFLARMGFDGSQRVVDPMCGSGTFVLEAAEIARGLAPGRVRGFAFEDLVAFDADAWARLRAEAQARPPRAAPVCLGYDRDAGAVRMAEANAERAQLRDACAFACQPVSALRRPEGPPGLVMVNPPYGARIGDRRALFALYGALGAVLKERMGGWRVGLVTSDAGLAQATALPFEDGGPPVQHGGLTVRLYQTGPLPL
jgi:putative N6-adenine-specific DNA methylase